MVSSACRFHPLFARLYRIDWRFCNKMVQAVYATTAHTLCVGMLLLRIVPTTARMAHFKSIEGLLQLPLHGDRRTYEAPRTKTSEPQPDNKNSAEGLTDRGHRIVRKQYGYAAMHSSHACTWHDAGCCHVL